MIKKYFKNILISIDQLVNTLLGGDPDETISARVGRNYEGTLLAKIIDWLFSWQGNVSHTENAEYWEKNKGDDSIIK